MEEDENVLRKYLHAVRNNLFKITDAQSILHLWVKHAMIIDLGEDGLIPDDFTEVEKKEGVWWKHLIAGGVAGAVSRTFTAPLDRMKVFFQVHSQHSRQTLSICVNGMFREGGLSSFWRGNGVNVLKIVPETAIKFSAYEQIKVFIVTSHKPDEELRLADRFIAGASAGAIAQLIIYPLEVLKTRLALRNSGELKGILNAVSCIYNKEGVKSFYRGLVPNMCGIGPYAGIDLTVYETLKRHLLNQVDENEKALHPIYYGFIILMCGTISSTTGQLCSYPFALVRTRLQAQSVVHLRSACTMSGEFTTILQKDGFFGLYRGMLPACLKVVPAVSISYLVYELMRNALGLSMT